MNELLDNYLCKKYPKIFVERNLSEMVSAMGQGFCCGDGWFFIINSLCDRIQIYIDNHNYWHDKGSPGAEEKIEQVVALQVKEKFSGLRFYCKGGDNHTAGLVDMVEHLSYDICEVCGKGDQTIGRNIDGWVRTTCPEHSHSEDSFKSQYPQELLDIFEKMKTDG
jgi:hypothetical protein